MEQKFVKFEEAVEKLGISAERLNQLREDGELRAYRDGASWKFRADEIDRLVTDGVPEPAPPSDIGLVDSKDLVEASPLKSLDDLDDLSLADDELSLGGSELEIAPDEEDTVTAGMSDAALNIHADTEEGSDPSDSILLSEEALGESLHAPSTIIGRSEVEGSDLELVTEDDDELTVEGSDVQLAAGASNVLSSGVAGSGVLDELEKESGNTSAFENLEELEIDLAGEASRILTPQDTAAVKGKGRQAQQKAPAEDSDLTLDDGMLAGEDEGTDPVPEALGSGTAKAKKTDGPTSDLELATDEDDFVLASEGGSDITLDSGDSGINLISPSDSGLALDDIPLEMGGSAILESLSLGDKGGGSDLSLVGSDPRLGQQDEPLAALQTDDDFRLTPLGDKDEEGDSSSQVIALDAGLDDLGAADVGMLGEDAFAEEEGVVVTDDYSQVGDVGMAPAYAVAARADSDYSLMNILGLGSCMFLLLFAVVLMLDMVRNIWSWDANLALNDSLLDSLLGLFGLQ
jgi:excisionase family DNA binding protein